MIIRKTEERDLLKIGEIYENAKRFMRENGNPDQWSNGEPNIDSARRDMENGVGYVAEENGEILAVFMFYNGRDKTYDKIYGGDWLNSRSYSVIHRIAVAKQGLNIMSHCIEFCRGISDNIKIDTHKDNVPMQKALAKRGFRYCGIIHLENGEERLAYQWQAPEKQKF